MRTKLQVAIIGCGRISDTYQRVFQKLSTDIDVKYAVDKNIDRAIRFASMFKDCIPSSSIDCIVNDPDVDVVHICTPHFLHKEQAVACLSSGHNVLTEKPIALSTDDARTMIATAKDHNVQLGVIFQNRYIEGVKEVKRMIKNGDFGEIKGVWSHLAWFRPASYYECDWKGSWEKEGGGVVIDQAIHSIDLVRYMLGEEASSVQAHIARRILTNIEVEDEADAAIRFESGAIYAFSACNYFVENSPIRIEIAGTKGKCLLTESTMNIKLEGMDPYTIKPLLNVKVGPSYWGAYHEAQISDYYSKLKGGEKVPWDPEDATKTLDLVLSIYQSAKENRTVLLHDGIRVCS
jgi:UDP-N-acetyl-2-amino-2-deoxyglucuronate dehydrogenase